METFAPISAAQESRVFDAMPNAAILAHPDGYRSYGHGNARGAYRRGQAHTPTAAYAGACTGECGI